MKTNKSNRWLVKLLALCIVLLSVAGVTLSYLIDESNDVVNTFVPGKVDIQITENAEIKDNEMLKNAVVVNKSGEEIIDAYVRAKVIPIWRDGEGSVIGEPHYQLNNDGTAVLSYTAGNTIITITIADGWLYKDGTFYYEERLAPGESAEFVGVVKVIVEEGDAGTTSDRINDLEVQILAEGIQADGTVNGIPAVEDAWGVVTVSGDKLVEKTNN